MTTLKECEYLGLATWRYDRYFEAPKLGLDLHPVVNEIEKYVETRKLESHSFFDIARSSRHALRLWVSQELVMTNAFSQIVLRAASGVPNVHIRAILTEVAFGEHGLFRKGAAKNAHPHLLDQLRRSIELDEADVKPTEPCMKFLEQLAANCCDTLSAIAAIGVGNERLIIPEYNGIRLAFSAQWPDANYEPFLKANIDEDIGHTKLCYQAASLLITNDVAADKFLGAAINSVDARWHYFDGLVALLR